MKTSTLLNCLAVLVLGTLVLVTGLPAYAGEPVTPIPPGPETTLPDYIGAPAKAASITKHRGSTEPAPGAQPVQCCAR